MFTYQQALDYIYSFVDQEKLVPERYVPRRFDLENMTSLLTMLGNPHRRLRAVHVAGTKGKGSTCAMTASILQASGYRVGLFTQPHLHTFRERIRINDRLMSEHEMVAGMEELKPFIERLSDPTTFEIMTALAFQYFAGQQVDLAVVETGLGGRLDTTNVLQPLVAVITSISYDHTYILGDTIEEIASEKAGIIKGGKPVVCAPQRPAAEEVIIKTCQERKSPLTLVGRDWLWDAAEADVRGQFFRVRSGIPDAKGLLTDGDGRGFWIPLLGRHQLVNATTAIATTDQLFRQEIAVSSENVAEGLRAVHWPGRMEVLGRAPLLVVDGAHNVDSVQRLLRALREHFVFDKLILLVGFSLDKDVAGMMRELLTYGHQVVVTQADHPRAAHPETVMEKAELAKIDVSKATTVYDVPAALSHTLDLADEEDLVCVIGSLFVVAAARAAWLEAKDVEFEQDPPL